MLHQQFEDSTKMEQKNETQHVENTATNETSLTPFLSVR